mmetsp:Transcript_65826/g.170143  ORF Transcript_65826/g.170143 Transcript_65826/m.170143 type:complete len:363 (+) Transcript_65826:38-1126(+)
MHSRLCAGVTRHGHPRPPRLFPAREPQRAPLQHMPRGPPLSGSCVAMPRGLLSLLPCRAARTAADVEEHLLSVRQVHDVGRLRERLRDVLGGVDAPHLDEATAVLLQGFRDHLGGLGLALGPDDGRLSLLLGLGDDELLLLRLLLRDLLFLDGPGEFLAVSQVGDGNVVHQDVELARPRHDCLPDLPGDVLSVGQQLLGVVLGDGRLHDLVGDRGQHALVVVFAQGLVDGGQPSNIGLEEHPDVNGHHLQILGASGGLDEFRPDAYVVPLRLVEPRHPEVRALTPDLVLDTGEHVEDHGPLATIDVEEEKSWKHGSSAQSHTGSGEIGQRFVSHGSHFTAAAGSRGRPLLQNLAAPPLAELT